MADDVEKPAAVAPHTRVAITGASGFIGGRLAERLLEQGAAVTCLLRPGSAAERLRARGAATVALDLADPEATRATLAGTALVFHCAHDWQDAGWNHAALRSLIAACLEHGCRLVHVSSFVVYALPSAGEVTEETPLGTTDPGYAGVKRALDEEVRRAVRERGLAASIVQPTIVYGPHSRPWTIEPADMLLHGTVVLPDSGGGVCNAVHVDDVASAMILAATRPEAIGETFLVSGPPASWSEFYEGIAAVLGTKGPRYMPAEAIARQGSKARKLLRLIGDPGFVLRRAAQVGKVRKLVRSGLAAAPAGWRQAAEARLLSPITRRPGHVHMPGPGRLGFLQSRAAIHSGKARQLLGYAPRFDLHAGLAATAGYLRERYGTPDRRR